jgi:hypothetical protein
MGKQSVNTKHGGGNKNTPLEMQASREKSACKSNKIAKTPLQDSSAEVTPSMKISKREQAKAKKIKQGKQKRMADFFGQGPRVPAPLQEGTPIDAGIQQRENRGTDCKEGKGKSPSTELVSLKRLTKVKAMKQLQTEDKGERRQGDGQTSSKKSTKKSSCKGSDDKISCQSKRNKSDDVGSALGGEQPNSAVVSLEAMK